MCPSRLSHKPSCTQCAESFAVLEEIAAAIKVLEVGANSRNAHPLEMQKLDQLKFDTNTCTEDLLEYRGHLARQISELEKAREELEGLDDITAKIVSDYKMKALSCFFRENQKKWFAKRGTTTLGFMIITNPLDADLNAKGMKDVTFAMMVTNDGRQDAWAVQCAKSYIYETMLPKRIKKAIFVADGAGCFKNILHRASQGFWQTWTGIEEIIFRLTPAGDGKSCLDGMFGRMSQLLSSSVDNGASYFNAETMLDAIESSGGLSATTFLIYKPDRTSPLSVELSNKDTFSTSILTTVLSSDCTCNTSVLSKAYKHTGFGNGALLTCSTFKFFIEAEEGEKKSAIDFYDAEVSSLLLLLLLLRKQNSSYQSSSPSLLLLLLPPILIFVIY